MTAIRVLSIEEARTHETHCPRCKSTDYYAHNMQQEGPQSWQRFQCEGGGCEARWTEVFQLARIEDWTDE